MGGGGQQWAWWGGTLDEETSSIFLLHQDLWKSTILFAQVTFRLPSQLRGRERENWKCSLSSKIQVVSQADE